MRSYSKLTSSAETFVQAACRFENIIARAGHHQYSASGVIPGLDLNIQIEQILREFLGRSRRWRNPKRRILLSYLHLRLISPTR
jgi:hypothetical protein